MNEAPVEVDLRWFFVVRSVPIAVSLIKHQLLKRALAQFEPNTLRIGSGAYRKPVGRCTTAPRVRDDNDGRHHPCSLMGRS